MLEKSFHKSQKELRWRCRAKRVSRKSVLKIRTNLLSFYAKLEPYSRWLIILIYVHLLSFGRHFANAMFRFALKKIALQSNAIFNLIFFFCWATKKKKLNLLHRPFRPPPPPKKKLKNVYYDSGPPHPKKQNTLNLLQTQPHKKSHSYPSHSPPHFLLHYFFFWGGANGVFWDFWLLPFPLWYINLWKRVWRISIARISTRLAKHYCSYTFF